MEQQEYFMKMQMLGQEAEKIEQQIQVIDQQVVELASIKESINTIKEGKQNEILANLGKGIFIKADLREKDRELFVNVGKDIVIKRTPEETIKIIDEQLAKLNAGKEEFVSRISDLQIEMQNLLIQVQKEQQTHGKHECKCKNEECECEEECEDCECERR